MRVVTTGGGGWGDPLEREPDLVARDVIEGKVSAAAARDDYGVVLVGDFAWFLVASTRLRPQDCATSCAIERRLRRRP